MKKSLQLSRKQLGTILQARENKADMFKYFIIAVSFSCSSLIHGQDSLLFKDSIDTKALADELNQRSDQEFFIDDTELFVSFPGGMDAFYQYVRSNLTYPDSAIALGLGGLVIVSFDIDSLGKISTIKIERGDYSCLNREVVRLISSMPDWVWDKKIPVRKRKLTKRTLPIVFNLNANKN